jgi:hypothetical protein
MSEVAQWLLWPFQAHDLGSPLTLAFIVYWKLTEIAALALVVMLSVPRWRSKLYAIPGGVVLYGLGIFGLAHSALHILFIPMRLEKWSPTAANAVAIGLVVLFGIAALTGITFWMISRLRGPRAVHRISWDIAYVGGMALVMAPAIAFYEWTDYHTRGILLSSA